MDTCRGRCAATFWSWVITTMVVPPSWRSARNRSPHRNRCRTIQHRDRDIAVHLRSDRQDAHQPPVCQDRATRPRPTRRLRIPQRLNHVTNHAPCGHANCGLFNAEIAGQLCLSNGTVGRGTRAMAGDRPEAAARGPRGDHSCGQSPRAVVRSVTSRGSRSSCSISPGSVSKNASTIDGALRRHGRTHRKSGRRRGDTTVTSV